MKTKNKKKPTLPSRLERDQAGYVHTPAGFIRPADYKRIVRENPDAGLPEYDAIPVMRSPELPESPKYL